MSAQSPMMRMRLSRGTRALTIIGSVATLACGTGQVGPGGSGTGGAAGNAGGTPASPGSGSASGSTAAATDAAAPAGARGPFCPTTAAGVPAYRMLRRLSEAEYNQSLIDIFGADPTAWANIQFVGDIRQSGQYDTYSDALQVNQPWLAALVDATFDRAQSLMTGPSAPNLLVAQCNAAAIDATCAQSMISTYGYRLFRRPLIASEVTDYVGLYNQAIGSLKLSPSDALAGVLATLMQSPNTLYIQELGQPSGANYRLGGYELASILSYGLTGTTPSKALLDSAGMGALDTPQGLTAAAQTMIQSAGGQAHVSKFFLEWLAYDGVPYAAKEPTVYNFPNTIATAMVKESQLLIDDTYKNGGGLAQLLLAPQTYVNLSLAQHYGWSTTGLTDTQFVKVQRPAGQGVGILSQGGFLTRLATPNSSSPTQRGVFVLRSLMCKDVGSPPPNVPNIPVPTGNVTTRQRYEKQHALGGCATCHSMMDPIGFGLENFDGVGVFRTQEGGKPIDASGTILALGGTAFNGPADLAQKLATAPELSQCFAAQLTAYVLGVSVTDGLCIAPATAYPSATPLSLAGVLNQVVEPAHLVLRSPR
jgi:hypothetical protein